MKLYRCSGFLSVPIMDNRLFPLVQYFGLLSPTDKLEWPSGLHISTIQEFLVEQILDSEHFNAFPPSPTFQRRFWKWIVEEIEGHGEEVDERIYTRCLNLLSGSSSCYGIYASAASNSSYLYAAAPSQILARHRQHM